MPWKVLIRPGSPGFAPSYNNGEVFYGMVPDPSGQKSCAYSRTFVRGILPVTFIHEFQHQRCKRNKHLQHRKLERHLLNRQHRITNPRTAR